MQITYPYRALGALRAPGTMVNGYQAGDGVPAAVVDAWELNVGTDVMPIDTSVVPRPADDESERRPWEAYVIGQGTPVADAQAMSLDDLRKVKETRTAEPEPIATPGDRPEPDALKADWVAWAIANGADKTWANDRSTTKAELQDFTPRLDGPTATPVPPVVADDPVAASASEMQADANEKA